MIKAVLLDFDGTIVNEDILDVLCGMVSKKDASKKLNEEFLTGKVKGLTALVTRINFLRGVSVSQIQSYLSKNPYLVKGTKELLSLLKQQKIITILHSGNIFPVLNYYKTLLAIDYIVGTKPKIRGDKIEGISEKDFSGKDFKVREVKKILDMLGISPDETIAIWDSPADREMFEFAGKSIAINPKNGVEKYADYVIYKDLSKEIPIIKELNKITKNNFNNIYNF